jgi:hypothetical protein
VRASSFLLPLLQLADRDTGMGTRLVAAITQVVVSATAPPPSAPGQHQSQATPGRERLASELRAALGAAPREAGYSHALLQIALCLPGLKVTPGHVGSAALVAGSLQSGVLQLEDQLLQGTKSAAPAQAQQAAGQQRHSHWSVLAQLYGELEEADLVRTTAATHLGLGCSGTLVSLDQEAAGCQGRALSTARDLRAAAEASSRGEGLNDKQRALLSPPPGHGNGAAGDEEHSMWGDSVLRCLESLGEWRQLEAEVRGGGGRGGGSAVGVAGGGAVSQ